MISARKNWLLRITVWFVLITFSISGLGWASPLPNISAVSNQSIISIPKSLGSVEENFKGIASKPTIIYIQDAHANPSAQKNIKAILELLSKKNGFSTVGVEGADSRINPDLLNLLPDAKINLEVSRELLEEGRLSGAELFALENQNKVLVVGVDDRDLYQENLSDYRRIADESASVLPTIEKEKRSLREKKKSVYDGRLIELEDRKEFSTKSPQTILSYVSYLAKLAERVLDLNLMSHDSAAKFPSFVRLLILAKDKELSAEHAERLKSELVGPALFDEMGGIEKRIYANLLTSEAAKTFYVQSQTLELLKKTILLEATRAEVETLRNVFDEVSFNELFADISFQAILSDALHFYEVAQLRDSNFVSKISRMAESQKLKGIVLVTGGFHREGITRQLKQNGYSYAVVSPELSLLGENKYREIMTEKVSFSSAPLEVHSVDVPKFAAEGYLGREDQAVLNTLRFISFGAAREIEEKGGVTLDFVNARLKNGVRLEAVTSWPDSVELLFDVASVNDEKWVDVIQKGKDFQIAGVYPVIRGNSLGSEYGSKKILTLEPARIAINLGGPDADVYKETGKIFMSSNIEKKAAASNINISHNRIFDAFMRAIVGDPNISVTDIFGVRDPERLYQLVRANTFHGEFPGQISFDNQTSTLKINGKDIRIHDTLVNPESLKSSNVQYFVDFTSIQHTGEPQEAQRERLAKLREDANLMKVIIINPQADYISDDSAPLVVGLNNEVYGQQIISVASPLTQSAAHILALIDGKLKSDVDYVSDLEIRTMNQQGDRELHKIDEHAMGSVLHALFPDFAPRKTDVEEVSPIEAVNLEAPFKGAAYVDMKFQLLDSAKIIKDLQENQKKSEKAEKEAKKLSEAAKTDKSLKDQAEAAKKEFESLKAQLEDLKKKYIKSLNAIFKEAAEGPLKGLLRYAIKDEAINSLKLQFDQSLVIFDSEKSSITAGGQLILKFWVGDIGQGHAIAEAIKQSLVKDQAPVSQNDLERIELLQKEFEASGDRAVTNVIPLKTKPAQKSFLLPGENKIKYGIQGGRGRIGKYVLRLLWDNPNYEPAFLNGVESVDNLIHQLVVDEVHGLFPFIAKRKVVDGKPVDVVQLFDRKTNELRFEIPVFNYRMRTEQEEEELEKKNKELSDLESQKQGTLEGDAAKELDKRIDSKKQEIASVQGRLDGFKNNIKKMAQGVETVFNATGIDLYIDNALNNAFQEAGVKRVILTAPKSYKNDKNPEKQKKKDKAHASVLFGANEAAIDSALKESGKNIAVISAVSCTTNGLGPGLAEYLTSNRPSVIDAYFLTDHGFTISQGALFGAPQSGKSLRTANDPTLSALPESSGANKAFVEAVPWMKGKIEGESARTANQDGSVVRTFIKMKFEKQEDIPTVAQVNDFFRKLANGKFKGVFGFDDIKNTSQLLGRTESSILDPSMTKVVLGRDSVTIEVGEWYDNEGGYTQRVIDVERYAAMVSRGIDPKTGVKKIIPQITSAVKLPGNQRLRPESDEYKEIVSSISRAVTKPVSANPDVLMKQVVDLLQERRVPLILKGKEIDNFNALADLLKAISENSVSERRSIVDPYTGREIKDIDIKAIDLGDSSFKTSKGNHYFGISEYKKDDKKLVLYLPDTFFANRFADPEKNASAIQLVLMFLFQEVVGLSYNESLIAISNYNSKATRKAADGNTALPDLIQAMLEEIKLKANAGDKEASSYLNKTLNSEVSFVVSDEIRTALESHGRTPGDIQSIQAELSRIAFLVNHHISLPLGLRSVAEGSARKTVLNRIPAAGITEISKIKDDLNTEDPDEAILAKESNSKLIAAANALAPVMYGYLGASQRVANGDQKKITERLLDGVPIDETTQILEQLGRSTEIVSAGGSVRDMGRPHFRAGDSYGSGKRGFLILNPMERKKALYENKPGAVSVAVYADSESALGKKLPSFYVNAFVGHLSRELTAQEIVGIKTDLANAPINPDDNPGAIISRWAQLNKKQVKDVVVHVLDVAGERKHETERIKLLEEFSKTPEGTGLTINKIESGTFEGALKSAWGDNNGKLHIYLSTSGAAEIQTVMVLAGKEHSYVRFGIMSRTGLSAAANIRPENAYRFSDEEELVLEHVFPDVKGKIFTSGIVGNDASGDFDASFVPITDNELFGLPGIKKVGVRAFEVTILRVVRKTDQHLYRWIEKFRAEVDAVNGITWIAIPADTPVASAKSLGGSNIDRALEQLLKDNGFSDRAIAKVASQGALWDYFQKEITQGQLEIERLQAYSESHPNSVFTSLFGTEKSGLGVTVTTTSIASPEAIVTRLLSNKGSVAIVVRDSQFDGISSYAKLAEKLNLKDRLLISEPLTYNSEDVKSLITGIMSGRRFKVQGGELVTLAKVAGKFANLGQGVKLDSYLKQHTVVLADSQILPDANRVPGIQLISVDHNKLDDTSWQQYRLLASGVAMKLASAGNADALPYDIRSALKPISSGVFGFQDDFAKMLSSLWNEFQGYQMAGQSA